MYLAGHPDDPRPRLFVAGAPWLTHPWFAGADAIGAAYGFAAGTGIASLLLRALAAARARAPSRLPARPPRGPRHSARRSTHPQLAANAPQQPHCASTAMHRTPNDIRPHNAAPRSPALAARAPRIR